MVASECFWNHFISEKYITIQSFKLHFPPNSPLVKPYTLLVTVKVLETFLEAILWKSCRLFHHILNYVNSITKVPSLQCWFQVREQVKISWSQYSRVWQGCFSILTLFFGIRSLTKTDQCAGALSRRRNQMLVLHFFMLFLLTASLRWWRMSVSTKS